MKAPFTFPLFGLQFRGTVLRPFIGNYRGKSCIWLYTNLELGQSFVIGRYARENVDLLELPGPAPLQLFLATGTAETVVVWEPAQPRVFPFAQFQNSLAAMKQQK